MGVFDPINSNKVQYQGAGQVAGSNIAASGTSGVASYVGPWMVEKQRLDIQYVRVPAYNFDSAASATLSGANWDFSIACTTLDARVEAFYSKKKVNEPFTTSAYLQNQTFELNSVSADAAGMVYGPSTDFTASCLGPVGNINTLEEFYHRRKWNDLIDTEVDKAVEGYNLAAYNTSSCAAFAIAPWFGNFRRTPGTCYQGSPMWGLGTDQPNEFGSRGPRYYINGGYSYNKESMGQIIAFIDGAGNNLGSIYGGLFTDPAEMNEQPHYCIGQPTVFLPEYDSSRHQWL